MVLMNLVVQKGKHWISPSVPCGFT